MVITGIFYYKQGTIRVSGWSPPGLHREMGERGTIKKMSNKSRQRLALFVAETTLNFKTMVTLTYRLDNRVSGDKAKQDLRVMLKYFTNTFKLVGYFWFAEFTQKGQIHFHVLLDVKLNLLERHQIAQKWAYHTARDEEDLNFIYYAHTRKGAIQDIIKPDGAKRYALKYALKSDCKKIPERFCTIGRFWGFNRKFSESIPKPDFIRISEPELREVLKATGNDVWKFDHLPSVIFHRTNVSRETIGQNED